MLFTTQTLQSEAIWLLIDSSDLSQIPTRCYSNITAEKNAQLNQLCLQKTQAWLTEIGIESTSTFTPAQMDSIWDMVNGCPVTVGNRRIILIPSIKLDRQELSVPQEWVDIPAWMGDYYVAVQIDLDDRTMNIWGYTSHRTLRETGTYNQFNRTYSLDGDLLVPKLDILWMAQLLDLQEIAIVRPISMVAINQSTNEIDLLTATLRERLSHFSPYSPRLNIDFNTWATIISDNNLRENLYQRRLRVTKLQAIATPALSLTNWLQQEFNQALDQGWDLVQNIIMEGELAAVRGSETPIFHGEKYLVERAKLINLQYQLNQTNVVMLIGVTPQDAAHVTVSVQIHAIPIIPILPPQLKLSYITNEGEELQSVISRSHDFQIQLPTFTCDLGTAFNIQLQLNGVSQIEKFTA
jgi:Protein of unknown function (DUF1822)